MCSERSPLGIVWGWRYTCAQENHKELKELYEKLNLKEQIKNVYEEH